MISTIAYWSLALVMLYVLTHMAILNNGKKTKFFEKKTQRFLYWGMTIASAAAQISGHDTWSLALICTTLAMWIVNYAICSGCSQCAECESLLCMSFSERNIFDRAIIWAIRKFNVSHFKNK